MNKIEPVAWALRENGGICFDKAIADKWDDKPSPLWTDDALQAVAEAVHQQWLLYCDNQSEMEMPDIAAIINQLKGD